MKLTLARTKKTSHHLLAIFSCCFHSPTYTMAAGRAEPIEIIRNGTARRCHSAVSTTTNESGMQKYSGSIRRLIPGIGRRLIPEVTTAMVARNPSLLPPDLQRESAESGITDCLSSLAFDFTCTLPKQPFLQSYTARLSFFTIRHSNGFDPGRGDLISYVFGIARNRGAEGWRREGFSTEVPAIARSGGTGHTFRRCSVVCSVDPDSFAAKLVISGIIDYDLD
jgi:hypothetical protein